MVHTVECDSSSEGARRGQTMAIADGARMKQVSKILLSIAVTLVSLVATVAACVTILNLPSAERNDVAAACKEVRVGMTFAQMSVALHGTSSFSHETADFIRNEYVYSGRSGSCLVSMGSSDARVKKVQFDPPQQYASPVR